MFVYEQPSAWWRRLYPLEQRLDHARAVRQAGPPEGATAEQWEHYLRVLDTWAGLGLWLGRRAPPTFAEYLETVQSARPAQNVTK